MELKVDEEWSGRWVADQMIWHYENAPEKKARKAAKVMAMYYMTYDECVSYFGPEETARVWKC